jgi:TetR/AcrR family transcriptional repressor of bet genes
MADVTKDAGLSLGIVNLHFQSKDKLLEETLLYLSNEYQDICTRAVNKAGDSAEEKMAALVNLDFSAKVCDRKKLAVWFAYWGEAKSRPTYLQICAKSDEIANNVLAKLCDELKKDPAYKHIKSQSFAVGLSALVNGLWLDLLMTPNAINRKEACEICFDYLAVMFPNHFSNN